MVLKVYISGMSGNKEVKKRQQRVLMILDSKNIKYETIDITEPGRESDKEFMQNKSTSNGATVSDPDPRHALPPQIFNDEGYCGDYDAFDLANEIDTLEQFLKLEQPESNVKTIADSNADNEARKQENGEDNINGEENKENDVSEPNKNDETNEMPENLNNDQGKLLKEMQNIDDRHRSISQMEPTGDQSLYSSKSVTDDKIVVATKTDNVLKEALNTKNSVNNVDNDDVEKANQEKKVAKEKSENDQEARQEKLPATEKLEINIKSKKDSEIVEEATSLEELENDKTPREISEFNEESTNQKISQEKPTTPERLQNDNETADQAAVEVRESDEILKINKETENKSTILPSNEEEDKSFEFVSTDHDKTQQNNKNDSITNIVSKLDDTENIEKLTEDDTK